MNTIKTITEFKIEVKKDNKIVAFFVLKNNGGEITNCEIKFNGYQSKYEFYRKSITISALKLFGENLEILYRDKNISMDFCCLRETKNGFDVCNGFIDKALGSSLNYDVWRTDEDGYLKILKLLEGEGSISELIEKNQVKKKEKYPEVKFVLMYLANSYIFPSKKDSEE